MIDLHVMDGRVLEAAREGEWMVVAWMAGVLTVGLALGVVAWLKGRRPAAVVVFVLLGAGVGIALVPFSWIEERLTIDSSMAAWVLIGIVGTALLVGLVAAVRLARPPSWWAQRRYDNDTYAAAIQRHRWTRVKPR